MSDHYPPRRSDPASEADAWMVVLAEQNVPRETRMAFVRWLKRSPEHVEEYFRTTSIHSLLRSYRQVHTNPVSKTPSSPDNVELGPWKQPPRLMNDGRGYRRFSWILLSTVATLSVAVAGFGVHAFFERPRAVTVSTIRGETKNIVGPDGSRLVLNTNSSVTFDIQRAARILKIERGQVFIEVAEDRARPFRVVTRDAVLTDIGTTFDIYVRPRDTVVSVLEGRVAVASVSTTGKPLMASGADESTTMIIAGQRATVAQGGRVLQVTSAKSELVTSWQHGRMAFDGMPLGEIAREFNRYNPQQITVANAVITELQLTGSFSTTDPASFLDTVDRLPDIAVEWRSPTEAIIVREQHADDAAP